MLSIHIFYNQKSSYVYASKHVVPAFLIILQKKNIMEYLTDISPITNKAFKKNLRYTLHLPYMSPSSGPSLHVENWAHWILPLHSILSLAFQAALSHNLNPIVSFSFFFPQSSMFPSVFRAFFALRVFNLGLFWHGYYFSFLHL